MYSSCRFFLKRYSYAFSAKRVSVYHLLPCAAGGKFPVNNDGRHTLDTVFFRTCGNLRFMHVMDLYVTRRAGKLSDEFNRLLAHRAPGAKDFNFSFGCHHDSPVRSRL